MSFKIKFTDEQSNQFSSYLFCGLSGSGRTTCAATFPEPLFINTDKGLATLNDMHVAEISLEYGQKTSKDIIELLLMLKHGTDLFENYIPKTVVFDTLTTFSYMLEEEIRSFPQDGKNRADGLFMGDYNIIKTRLLRTIELAKTLPMNVIFISNLSKEKDETLGAMVEAPAVSGSKLSAQIPHLFNEVYYFQYDTKLDNYVVNFKPTTKFPYCKTKNKKLKETCITKSIVSPTAEKLFI